MRICLNENSNHNHFYECENSIIPNIDFSSKVIFFYYLVYTTTHKYVYVISFLSQGAFQQIITCYTFGRNT